ncbi:uncharacterized protein LOC113758212 [Coffea eugenioides]|uniref:uncharacterized protein LOC113758212 n=1 Tax=Coffea eugenioides TaxID=49369 RepID=UPI000F612852|nr:uncharacterized protein LOC113758212 [Coffea eugenioides]
MSGMDVIGAIDPPVSNGHRFILVAIEYFTKWFKVRYRNSTIYRPQMNGTVEATNKNLMKIIRKITEAHRDWYEKLPSALMAYRTMIRTSTRATPHLMFRIEAVLSVEVEIPSLRILMEAQIEEAEWIRECHEQLSLIDEKRLNVVCHGQCYQRRMARAYNKRLNLVYLKMEIRS